MLADLRIALRRLASSPGFAVVAVFTLALGIGANTTIFSLVDGILIKPLPYPDSEALVGMYHRAPGMNMERIEQSDATYYNYAELQHTFDDMGLYAMATRNLIADGEPARLQVARFTPSLFTTLGVSPQLGRWFTPEEGRPGGEPVAVLSDALWRGRFGADSSLLGRTIRLDAVEHTIVGIMPRGFTFPAEDFELWTNLILDPGDLNIGNFRYDAVGRLAKGVSLETAAADLNDALYKLPENHPGDISRAMMESVGLEPFLVPLKQDVVGDVGWMLWMLLGTVAFVLLIACANVANLFLVRAEGRQREMALRSSLGASGGRLLRTYLTESVVLGILGGAVGIALTAVGHRLLVSLGGSGLPRLSEVTLDLRVMGFAAGISIVAGLVFGALPMARFSTAATMSALGEGGRRSTSGPERHHMRNLLVTAQVALALVLLIASGLMVRSFLRLREVPAGIDPENVLTLRLALPDSDYSSAAEAQRFFRQLDEEVALLPGVQSVGLTSILPFTSSGSSSGTEIEDFPRGEDEVPFVHPTHVVTPGYFEAMGISVLAGRRFDWGDTTETSTAAIVSEAFAEHYWPGEDAVGKRLRSFSEEQWFAIVGIVSSVRGQGLDEDPMQTLYYPMMPIADIAGSFNSMSLAIRTEGPPLALVDAVRQRVRELDAYLPIANVRTMDDYLSRSMARATFAMLMLAIAAGSALLLGTVGIYGVVAYIVSLRTREIGIRMALGARRRDVRQMVLKQGGAVVLVGIGVGLLGALALTRLMGALLFEISPFDAVTFLATPVLLAAVALLACFLPARRAAAVSPSVALRAE